MNKPRKVTFIHEFFSLNTLLTVTKNSQNNTHTSRIDLKILLTKGGLMLGMDPRKIKAHIQSRKRKPVNKNT